MSGVWQKDPHEGMRETTPCIPAGPGKVHIAMADIPIRNETDYVLTEAMTQDILRDAQEHFGDAIRAIRVQSDLQRHAWNARTHEVRYALSPPPGLWRGASAASCPGKPSITTSARA